jgi:hypothetical protein
VCSSYVVERGGTLLGQQGPGQGRKIAKSRCFPSGPALPCISPEVSCALRHSATFNATRLEDAPQTPTFLAPPRMRIRTIPNRDLVRTLSGCSRTPCRTSLQVITGSTVSNLPTRHGFAVTIYVRDRCRKFRSPLRALRLPCRPWLAPTLLVEAEPIHTECVSQPFGRDTIPALRISMLVRHESAHRPTTPLWLVREAHRGEQPPLYRAAFGPARWRQRRRNRQS